MSIYDYQGNGITITIDPEEIRDSVMQAIADGVINFGNTIGATLGVEVGANWRGSADTAYAAMLAAFKASPNSVPWYIATDQHGRGLDYNRYVNNIDVDLELCNFNLGDTVVDTYADSSMESFYSASKSIKNYIAIPGNHDYKAGTDSPDPYLIRKAFMTTNLQRKMINTSVLDCYVVYRPRYCVKVICADFYDSRGVISGMGHPYVNSEVATWLIEQLSEDDGYDIIFISHEPITISSKTREDTSEGTPASSGLAYKLFNLLKARKDHTSGTFTDSENVSHSFNFTGTKTDVLGTLHGHNHAESYSSANGLSSYICDWAGACAFGLFDRTNQKVKVYAFGYGSNKDELVFDM